MTDLITSNLDPDLKNAFLTQSIVKQLVKYDLKSGTFTYKFRPRDFFDSDRAFKGFNNRFAGKEAGVVINNGCGKRYILLTLLCQKIRAHHAAFIYVTGKPHRKLVDHINGNGMDNSWKNLRDNITYTENHMNVRRSSDNKSGVVGVHFDKSRKKYMAFINLNGKRRNLGRFKDKEDAVLARKTAERELGFHSNHGEDRPL